MTGPEAAHAGLASSAELTSPAGPADEAPQDVELSARWSAAHPGHTPDQSPLLHGWLRTMWRAGGPMARAGIPPSALSAAGVLCAKGAVLASRSGTAAGKAAAIVGVVASGVADGLDGSIAIQRPQWDPRTAARGALVDQIADRIADVCWAWTLRSSGAPRWAAVAVAAGSTAQELGRDALGSRAYGVTTVSERPTRMICAVIALSASIVAPQRKWPAMVGAAVWAGSTAVAIGQLAARTRPASELSGNSAR